MKIENYTVLNPATLMPASNSKIECNCCELIDQVYVSRSDLKDQPLLNQDEVEFSDGGSFMREEICYAGYAIVSSHKITEVQALPP